MAAERIFLSPPDVGEDERAALLRAFDSGWIAPVGPALAEFEDALAERAGVEAAVALSSGTAGLHLGLAALGVGPGDEVIVPTSTFAATAFAVCHVGATPVFVDLEPSTLGPDPALVAQAIASRRGRVRAVMSVDLYGRCAKNVEIEQVCRDAGLPLLEDAAEALGASIGGRRAGSFGSAGVFSFNGNKIITTSGGGALVGPREIVSRVRHLATQARQPVPHYEHLEVGYNARMSNLLAAIGVAQLAALDRKIDRRRSIAETYRRELPEISFAQLGHSEVSNHWLSVGMLPDGRSPVDLCRNLDSEQIEARVTWKPMHLQPVFAGAAMIGGDRAETVFGRGVCLPSGSAMTDGDLERVVDAVRRWLAR